MLKVMIKMIFRGWAKNKIYFVISMLSLIVGLTCSVLLIGFVANEYNIANVVKDGKQWYLLQGQNIFYKDSEVITNHTNEGGIGVAIQQSFPEVEDICVCHDDRMGIKKSNGEGIPYASVYAVTPSFADLFNPPLLVGNLKETLTDPLGIAVTRSFAMQNFGRENVLGETLLLISNTRVNRNGVMESLRGERTFTIKAILDDRCKSYLQYDLLIRIPEEDYSPATRTWTNSYYTFLKLNKNITKKAFEEKLINDQEYQERFHVKEKQQLQPLNQVYFSGDQQVGFIKTRDRIILYLAGSIALAIIVIACFNYINISMTKALQRLKNTSQQMVFGATRQEMRKQLIVETSIQVGMALLIAVLLIHSFLPVFNQFMQANLTLGDLVGGVSWGLLVSLLVAVILGPSLYIFSRINKNSLNDIMKVGIGQRPKLVTGMVVAQFAVSVVLMVMVLGIRQQMAYISHIRPDSDRILSLNVDNRDQQQWQQFRGQLQNFPEIEDFTASNILNFGAISADDFSAMLMDGDEHFVPFFGMKLVAGKGFDLSMPGEAVLVNETFVKKMGIQDPVNYRLSFNGEHLIVGVVEDFVSDNVSHDIQPAMIEFIPNAWNRSQSTLIKIKEGSRMELQGKLKALWKKISGGSTELHAQTMAEIYRDLHKEEQRVLQMTELFSWISLFLTALGLFGLAWYSVENRMKEIGLRKINGATQSQVVWLLCLRFVKWIGIALLMGIPISVYLLQQWRMQYVYKPQLTIGIFVGAACIVLVVGILTVIWQTWKAARVNPGDIIKAD